MHRRSFLTAAVTSTTGPGRCADGRSPQAPICHGRSYLGDACRNARAGETPYMPTSRAEPGRVSSCRSLSSCHVRNASGNAAGPHLSSLHERNRRAVFLFHATATSSLPDYLLFASRAQSILGSVVGGYANRGMSAFDCLLCSADILAVPTQASSQVERPTTCRCHRRNAKHSVESMTSA